MSLLGIAFDRALLSGTIMSSRLCRVVVLSFLAAIPSAGCQKTAKSVVDSTYDRQPKRVLVVDNLDVRLAKADVEGFRSSIVQQFAECGIVASSSRASSLLPVSNGDEAVSARANSNSFKADATLAAVVTGWRTRGATDQSIDLDIVLNDVASNRTVWSLQPSYIPPVFGSDGSAGGELGRSVVMRMAQDGLIKTCSGVQRTRSEAQQSSSTGIRAER